MLLGHGGGDYTLVSKRAREMNYYFLNKLLYMPYYTLLVPAWIITFSCLFWVSVRCSLTIGRSSVSVVRLNVLLITHGVVPGLWWWEKPSDIAGSSTKKIPL